MKKIVKFNTSVLIFSICMLTLFSCETSKENNNDAFNRFKKNKQSYKDTTIESKEIVHETMIKKVLLKTVPNDECTVFKNKMKNKLKSNDYIINKILIIPTIKIRQYKKLKQLENDNNKLMIQMKHCNEGNSEERTMFKIKMNNKAEKIGTALNKIKY